MRNATLLFLIKREKGKISDICLAMKKRGFGAGRWNGAGGKQHEGETVEETAVRETNEEIGVKTEKISKVAELTFIFPKNPDWDQIVHVYFSEKWDGGISESEEMKPKWFSVSEIPFKEMWPDDIFWVPKVLNNELVKASFSFGENDVILEKDVKSVKSL